MRLDWIAAQPVSFSNPLVAGLSNCCDEGRWILKMTKINYCDEGRRLQTARDGQELDPASASALLQSMQVHKLPDHESCVFATKDVLFDCR